MRAATRARPWSRVAQALGCDAQDLWVTDERGQAPTVGWCGSGSAPAALARIGLSISHAPGVSLVAWHPGGAVGVWLQPLPSGQACPNCWMRRHCTCRPAAPRRWAGRRREPAPSRPSPNAGRRTKRGSSAPAGRSPNGAPHWRPRWPACGRCRCGCRSGWPGATRRPSPGAGRRPDRPTSGSASRPSSSAPSSPPGRPRSAPLRPLPRPSAGWRRRSPDRAGRGARA